MNDQLFDIGVLISVVLAAIGALTICIAKGILPQPTNVLSAFPVLPWWAYVIIIIALAEVLFFLDDDDKPSKKSNVFEHTIGQKILWLAGSLIIVLIIQGIASTIYLIFPFVYKNWFNGLQAIGIIAIIIISLYLYIKINSLKYRKIKYKTKKKKRKEEK